MQCSARLLDVMKETYQVPISVYNLPIFLSRLARGTIVVTDAVVPRVVVGYTKRSLVVPTSDSIPKVEYNPSYPEGLLTYIGRSLTFKDGQRDSRSWWQCNSAAVFARGIVISAELDYNYASMVNKRVYGILIAPLPNKCLKIRSFQVKQKRGLKSTCFGDLYGIAEPRFPPAGVGRGHALLNQMLEKFRCILLTADIVPAGKDVTPGE